MTHRIATITVGTLLLVASVPTVIVAMQCVNVIVSINHYLSIYLSI